MTYSPTVRRRRLSAALRDLRKDAGMDATGAARQLGWPPSKLTRIERNDWRRPSVDDVRDLLDLYDIADERTRESLFTLAREGRQRGWWAAYADVFRSALPDFETEACSIRTYEPLLVPGLLQTCEYAEAVMRSGGGDALIERRVDARMARQSVLQRLAFGCVIDQAALRKNIGGPEVMRGQLEHLIEVSARPDMVVQVVPESVGAYPGMLGAFMILDFPDDPPLVYLETPTGALYLEQASELNEYGKLYEEVKASALDVDATRSLISDMTNRLPG